MSHGSNEDLKVDPIESIYRLRIRSTRVQYSPDPSRVSMEKHTRIEFLYILKMYMWAKGILS